MSDQAAENLKEQLEREVQAAERERERYLSELEETASAGRSADRPLGFEAVSEEEPALTVLRDKTLTAEKRIEVIERLGGHITRRDDYIGVLLEILQDADDEVPVRAAALKALGSAAFQVARFEPHEAAYQSALRNLVTDEDPGLRDAAVSTLATRHDPEVQQVLLAGLRGDGPLPVERERAIQLLAEDDHLDNLPYLQELYESGSPEARQEAVRLMGSYADASDVLEGVFRDKGETPEVRQQSGASLRNLAPDRFEAAAKEIATDGTDDPEVRIACLTTLHHLGDTDRLHGDLDFVTRLQEVGDDESAPRVAEGARGLIDELPDVRERDRPVDG